MNISAGSVGLHVDVWRFPFRFGEQGVQHACH
jgi:hypothetical protein